MTTEELMVVITAEINGLKQEMRKAQGEVDDFTKNSKKSFAAFNEGVQQVGQMSKKALSIVGTSLVAATAAIIGLSNSTHELRTNQAMLVSAFDTAGASAEVAKEVYNDLFRVLGDDGQAVEAAQHLAKLTTDQEALSEWTTITQGVWASYGKSLPLEGLTEAINHTAKLGEVQGPLADALEWAGVTVEDFNAELMMCNDEAEREALIRKTLGGLYNQAAADYEKNAKGVLAENEAQAKLNETMAELGAAITPLKTMFAEFGGTIAKEVTPHIEKLVNEHGAELAKVLGDIAEAIGDVLDWVIDNWDFIAPIAGIVLGIAAAMSVLASVLGVINAVTLASPVTWVVLAIVAALAALSAIIYVVIKNWDDIKGASANAVDFIKNAWKQVGDLFETWVLNPIKAAIDFIIKNFDNILSLVAIVAVGIVKAWKTIADLYVNYVVKPFIAGIGHVIENWDNIEGACVNAVDGMKNALKVIGEWFNTWVVEPIKTGVDFVIANWDSIKAACTNVVEAIINIWKTIAEWYINFVVKPLISGITLVIKNWDDIKNTCVLAVEGIKNALKVIGTWFDTWVVKPIKNGLSLVMKYWDDNKLANSNAVEGIKKAWGAIGTWFDKNVVTPVKTAIDKVKGFFKFEWSLPKIKTPTISISWGQSPAWMAEAAKLVGLEGVPKFSVAWNAMGGVFDKPTIFTYGNSLQGIGENGAEAVVPLENNLGWLDKLATMLNERQATRPMYLVAKGRVLAEVVADGINDITRQTGAMPLVVR